MYPPAEAREDLSAWRKEAITNAFTADEQFQRLLRRYFAGHLEPWVARFTEVGQELVRLFPLVEELERDENLPKLLPCDAFGNPTEGVAFHPLWEEVGRAFWQSGVLQLLAEPGQELVSGALLYLLDQVGEAGQGCPVACTAGAIKLLQQAGSPEQKQKYLPKLCTDRWESRLHAAQFVTEIQGGSDVGANEVKALPDPQAPNGFRLEGEKWFCSVADAGLFVVSARPPGAPAGTKGLGLFLVPRMVDGRPNGFRLRRLKWKLGTRSLATGEIEFSGAWAEPIGALDRGFRNLVGIVLDTSRVHNTVAAAAFLRTAEVWATTYARHRKAFGRPIGQFPEVARALAQLKLRRVTALLVTFRLLHMTDVLAQRPDDELAAARRLSVMLAKYWTSRWATEGVREAIELLGGNGTIEDFSPLPRLYRDAIVLESWEGSHNTLCAQVVRDVAVRGLGWPWLRNLEQELDKVQHPRLAAATQVARKLLTDLRARIQAVEGEGQQAASSWVRSFADACCRATDLVVLLGQANWELGEGLETALPELCEFYWRWSLEHSDPESDTAFAQLVTSLAG
ncbi:MAG: acyl-CoA dehydrogenase family protein [Thermoanaerobaculaceae bacterium]